MKQHVHGGSQRQPLVPFLILDNGLSVLSLNRSCISPCARGLSWRNTVESCCHHDASETNARISTVNLAVMTNQSVECESHWRWGCSVTTIPWMRDCQPMAMRRRIHLHYCRWPYIYARACRAEAAYQVHRMEKHPRARFGFD